MDEVADRLRARIRALPMDQLRLLADALGHPPVAVRESLVAYVTASDAEPVVDELHEFVSARLPEYMVPRRYVFLHTLPRTTTGKLDRRALAARPEPASEPVEATDTKRFTAPRTDAERVLADIWMAVLDTDEVDVHDDFFELGGDSILSIRVISRATQAGLAITPQAFFASPTIADLAAAADDSTEPE